MKILEYLTTLNDNNVSEITFNGKDVSDLNDFIKEFYVSNSTLDEADYDLNTLIRNVISEQADDEEQEAEMIEETKDLSKYAELTKEDVFVQRFEIENDKVKIILE